MSMDEFFEAVKRQVEQNRKKWSMVHGHCGNHHNLNDWGRIFVEQSCQLNIALYKGKAKGIERELLHVGAVLAEMWDRLKLDYETGR